jgi:CDP-paratose 2-epimerase
MAIDSCLITGGAGFVGSRLALAFAKDGVDVHVMDNLKRRGSELNLGPLQQAGISFYHGDVRCPSDFEELPACDLLIDCSAEPSVHAGSKGSPDYVVHTNLMGTYNMLEWARKHDAAFSLLSTSRVYPIESLNGLSYVEENTRYRWNEPFAQGASAKGISEAFPLEGPRSIYGTSKLCSEMLLQEYVHLYGLKGMINRCGILAGSHQMGKVDQGVVALWVARHFWKGKLAYHGYGGNGKQVRDMLHVDDLYNLLQAQLGQMEQWSGQVYNAGGGDAFSVSLAELTTICEEVTGNKIEMGSRPETSPLDLRCYITDSSKAEATFDWTPKISCKGIVEDIFQWLKSDEQKLKPLFM